MQLVAKVKRREDPEHRQRNHLLNHLQLIRRKGLRADSVGGNLEAVLEERNAPAHQDHLPQRHLTKLQVPVPSEGHKDVRADEQQNGPHERCVSPQSNRNQKDKMQRACRSLKTSPISTTRLPEPADAPNAPSMKSPSWQTAT